MVSCIIHVALEETQRLYEEKLSATVKVPEKTLHKLAWKIQELEILSKRMRGLSVDISSVVCQLKDEGCNLHDKNVALKLTSIRTSLLDAVKMLSKHQRVAATHIFAVLISTEGRNSKPYALPVQCLPIKTLKDEQARFLANQVVDAMDARGMKVAGK